MDVAGSTAGSRSIVFWPSELLTELPELTRGSMSDSSVLAPLSPRRQKCWTTGEGMMIVPDRFYATQAIDTNPSRCSRIAHIRPATTTKTTGLNKNVEVDVQSSIPHGGQAAPSNRAVESILTLLYRANAYVGHHSGGARWRAGQNRIRRLDNGTPTSTNGKHWSRASRRCGPASSPLFRHQYNAFDFLRPQNEHVHTHANDSEWTMATWLSKFEPTVNSMSG